MPQTKPRRLPRRSYPHLRAYLAQSGDTQARMARLLDISQAHISRIAHGHAVPRAALAKRIAAYAGIPLDSFTRVYLEKHGRHVA